MLTPFLTSCSQTFMASRQLPSLLTILTKMTWEPHQAVKLACSSFKPGSPGGSAVKNLPAMQEMQVWSLGQEHSLEEGMATHSSILAWRSPWAEWSVGLQSLGSQRTGHACGGWTHTRVLPTYGSDMLYRNCKGWYLGKMSKVLTVPFLGLRFYS